MKTELTLKVLAVGGGHGVIIPKDVLEKMQVLKGDRINITVEKAVK
jgi:antitoxin component of MazEF toxin-antitoxin module